MSALGFLVAPFAIDYVRSYMARLEQIDWNHLNGLFDEMERDARSLLIEAGAAECNIRRQADMRYAGQGFEIKVDLPTGRLGPASVPAIKEAFYNAYEQLFGRRLEDLPIETLSWRLGGAGETPRIELNFSGRRTDAAAVIKGMRDAHFPGHGFVACKVYDRYALPPGFSFSGPAIVEERESTVVIGPEGHVTIDEHLNLIVDIDVNGDEREGADAHQRSNEFVHNG